MTSSAARVAARRPPRSNSSLKYGAAWTAYRADEVADLDENTQGTYDGHYNTHLKKWANRRLDSFKKNDAAQLIRDLRAAGLSEWSIVGIVGVASRVFRYARQNLDWSGTDPFDLLDSRQRPKVSKTPPRRIYEGDELDQVIAATTEPWRTLSGSRTSALAESPNCLGSGGRKSTSMTWTRQRLTSSRRSVARASGSRSRPTRA